MRKNKNNRSNEELEIGDKVIIKNRDENYHHFPDGVIGIIKDFDSFLGDPIVIAKREKYSEYPLTQVIHKKDLIKIK